MYPFDKMSSPPPTKHSGHSVIPGWSGGPDPESRDSGFDASHRPGMTARRPDVVASPTKHSGNTIVPRAIERAARSLRQMRQGHNNGHRANLTGER